MGFFADVTNIVFAIGIIYGAMNVLPQNARGKAVSLVYRKPNLDSFQRHKRLVLSPKVTTISHEEPATFLDYIRQHLGDNLTIIERMAEGEPDLLVESQNFQEKFYIEPGYMPDFDVVDGNKGMRMDYLDTYRSFEETTGRKIFFVIGVGGMETRPERIYIFSVSEASPFMSIETLARFERPEPDLPIMYYYMKLR